MTEGKPLPDEAVALFREAPEDFVAARDRLVASLREHDRAGDAMAVKRLRKPTVVAWALDQLGVRNPDGVRALLDAGAEVRAAQQGALSSKRGAAVRLQTASATRKAAVAELAATAVAAITERGGAADAHADALVRALETCSVDPDAGARLSEGTFERPPDTSAGFGAVFGLTSIEGGRAHGDEAEPTATAAAPAGAGAAPRARAEATDDDVDLGGLRRDRDAAARRAKKARQAADGFAHELEGMRRRLEVVERKHAQAAASAAEAETELARAEKALRRATERR
jgi:hypothetical protein